MIKTWQLALIWLGLTASFAAMASHWQWSAAVAAHEREATNLHRIVSQRVDQHDAHLTGLSALTTSSSVAPRTEALAAVAATIIQFYPRILAIDIVALGEGSLATNVYTTRDQQNSVPADLIEAAWRRGSRRAEVISASGSTGHYLLVKRAPNSDAAKYAVSLEIDGQRLVETDGVLSPGMRAVLALADGETIYTSGAQLSDANGTNFRLYAERTLASTSQSMGLSLTRYVSAASFMPWGWICALSGISALLLLLVHNALKARHAARDAIARAATSAQEARIAQATRINAMGELSLGIAHELTQPLAALLSQSQAGLRMMKSDAFNPDAINSVLEANARHAKRAGQLLQKLRDWNSVDPPVHQVVDLNQVVTEIALLNKSDLDRRRIEPQLDLVEPAPMASADQIGLEQIAQNLLINARDACEGASPKGARIMIKTFVDGSHVGFTVSDEGPGISDDAADRLFEPFYTSKADGMGLGLSICRRLVDTFGGEIRAANRNDGRGGAIITVVVPRHPTDRAGNADPTFHTVLTV
jgi:two-component system, LuxR family, sensor kinase FixL